MRSAVAKRIGQRWFEEERMDQQSDDHLKDEAKKYVDNLPDENAAGRLVDDSGAPVDPAAWQAEHEQQESELRGDDAD
jgi:hypothetical protein